MPYSDVKLGINSAIPIVTGYLPVSIAFGVLAGDIIGSNSILMSILVFAGASQFASIQLFLISASSAFIIFTTFLINLRHILMGSYLNTYHRNHHPLKKLIIAFGITDETFAISTKTFQDKRVDDPFLYQLSLNATSYLSWVGGTAVGYLIGQVLPNEIVEVLPFTLTALFLYLLVVSIKSKLHLFVALVSAFLAVVFKDYIGWNIFISTITACLLGVNLEKFWKRSGDKLREV
jgi:4-azaleucine resistance transporter AzlC